MKKYEAITPKILMLPSIIFYYFGFFHLKSDTGEWLLGTWGFWKIGLTHEYNEFYMYFYRHGPNFITATFWLIIISNVFYLVYAGVVIFKKHIKNEKAYIVTTYIFSMLTYSFYASAYIIGVLFYSNKYHASYVLLGNGRIGPCPYFVILLQIVAVVIEFFNLFNYVLVPAYLKHKFKKEGAVAVKAINIEPVSPSIKEVPNLKSHQLKFYLIVSKGEYAGGKIPITDNHELFIGKDARVCEVVINNRFSKVSRRHCGILRKGYSIYLRDYSTNGTFRSFDGSRVQSGGILNPIKSGERFNLAKTDNEFYCQIE